ncbi:MAG: cysteine protease StiP family protein [Methylococcales bacterium]|nr:cysteine protease StiP family protein [Methylococcales bacterium]
MNHDGDFSGSYAPDDVRFLLKPIQVPNTPVEEKERLIQSGAKHYSEMLTHEAAPSAAYLQLFHDALAENAGQMAQHVLDLACRVRNDQRARGADEITLVSLARAGTPIGVLLKRVLQQRLFVSGVEHYSISIIRDRGIDENALRYLLRRHRPESLVFVDGWTGKGVIAGELKKSLHAFWQKYRLHIAPDLYVLTDLSGSAAAAASHADYLIPSSILNATVSGLISRSVLDAAQLSDSDFHGCHYYQDFRHCDLSNTFIDAILAHVADCSPGQPPASEEKQAMREQSTAFLAWVGKTYGVHNPNLIKPGIGEATRVLLRRSADRVLVNNKADPAIAHLRHLCAQKNIFITTLPALPYRAVALIRNTRS